jgi:uncharacterized membrane protein
MSSKPRVLVAGESWTTHSIHQKGFDSFTTTEYIEGIGWLKQALEDGGYEVVHQPAHVAARDFPNTAAALSAFACVMLSDVGANTLLLHPDTFVRSQRLPNRLEAIREYVSGGGGLVMIGGYLTFQGIEAKARYGGTAVEEALPVNIFPGDDRVEAPQGLKPIVAMPTHPIVHDIEGPWPALLGLNAVTAKPGADVIMTAGGHPLMVSGAFGQGRGVAFTSDCGPHWAPPEFVNWTGYRKMWRQLADWVSGRR